jgi:hypothetical protein
MMATPSEIIDGLGLLIDSGLDYAPKNADRLTDAWVQVFSDVPGAIFKRAISDWLRLESKWPAPAKLRDLAEKVKIHNAQSVAGDEFSPSLPNQHIEWLPSGCAKVKFPPVVEKRIAEIEAKYYKGGLPTDAELAEIDMLTGEGWKMMEGVR